MASGAADTGPVTTTSIGEEALPGNLVTSASETWRLAALGRSTPASGVPKLTFSRGLAASRSSAITGTAISAGRRVTSAASRPHRADSRASTARDHGTLPALTRRPSTASSAGRSTLAPSAAMATTPIPA